MSEYDQYLEENPDLDMANAMAPEPQSRDAHLEGKVVALPETIGEPDTSEESPPEPPFLIHKGKFGPGTVGVYRSDGEPVGVWLDRVEPSLDGGQVAEALIYMGLDGELAAWFGLQRDRRRAADDALLAAPAVRRFAISEAHHDEKTAALREAFIKEKAKEQKGK